eukprot:4086400-Amphidinium_carterae.1
MDVYLCKALADELEERGKVRWIDATQSPEEVWSTVREHATKRQNLQADHPWQRLADSSLALEEFLTKAPVKG